MSAFQITPLFNSFILHDGVVPSDVFILKRWRRIHSLKVVPFYDVEGTALAAIVFLFCEIERCFSTFFHVVGRNG